MMRACSLLIGQQVQVSLKALKQNLYGVNIVVKILIE